MAEKAKTSYQPLEMGFKELHGKFQENSKYEQSDLFHLTSSYVDATRKHLMGKDGVTPDYKKLDDLETAKQFAKTRITNLAKNLGITHGDNLSLDGNKDLGYLNHKFQYLTGQGIFDMYKDIIKKGSSYNIKNESSRAIKYFDERKQQRIGMHVNAITMEDKDFVIENTGLEEIIKREGLGNLNKDKISLEDLKQIQANSYFGQLNREFIETHKDWFKK